MEKKSIACKLGYVLGFIFGFSIVYYLVKKNKKTDSDAK